MMHIVEFDGIKGCHNCKYSANDEETTPCDECIAEPVKEDGRAPLHWVPSDAYLEAERKRKEEKEKKEKKNARRN